MNLLTLKFKSENDEYIQNFITNEFSGSNRYETQCKSCNKFQLVKALLMNWNYRFILKNHL